MRSPFALGTLTREHRLDLAEAGVDTTDQGFAELDRVTTTTLIERLLEPQHGAMRSALQGLRAVAVNLARRDRSRAHVMRRAAGMLDDLSELMLDQFEHEERSIFPFLRAGVAPIHQLGEIHDHHDDVADRIRRLRALASELPPGPSGRELRSLLEGLESLDELARHHRELERHALLARYS
ncbi:MAG TPA: hemerythrin domain-containing protein [Kofleriaceae bacterium]|nr:hemerythrin domain-containing protein [Kofleriaceae bacterium]